MAMGLASGYPVGAKLTAQLWNQKLVNREEGERLVAFTTSSDPIFLIGAVSVGFFHDASLAMILAIAHYGGSVLIGLVMRFHGSGSKLTPMAGRTQGSIWVRAFESMHKARLEDGRPIGVLLSQAVRNSLSLIVVVGGLVVFFSVVLEVLTASRMMNVVYTMVNSLLHGVGLPSKLSEAVMNGLFEVTLGAKAAGAAGSELPLASKAAIAAFVLSWGGLSVHAQIVSLLSHTNLRYAPFAAARFLHGLLAASLVILLWEPLQPLRRQAAVFLPFYDAASPLSSCLRFLMPTSGVMFFASFAVIALLFAAYSLLTTLYAKVGEPRL